MICGRTKMVWTYLLLQAAATPLRMPLWIFDINQLRLGYFSCVFSLVFIQDCALKNHIISAPIAVPLIMLLYLFKRIQWMNWDHLIIHNFSLFSLLVNVFMCPLCFTVCLGILP
jgi:hypothetical protein